MHSTGCVITDLTAVTGSPPHQFMTQYAHCWTKCVCEWSISGNYLANGNPLTLPRIEYSACFTLHNHKLFIGQLRTLQFATHSDCISHNTLKGKYLWATFLYLGGGGESLVIFEPLPTAINYTAAGNGPLHTIKV